MELQDLLLRVGGKPPEAADATSDLGGEIVNIAALHTGPVTVSRAAGYGDREDTVAEEEGVVTPGLTKTAVCTLLGNAAAGRSEPHEARPGPNQLSMISTGSTLEVEMDCECECEHDIPQHPDASASEKRFPDMTDEELDALVSAKDATNTKLVIRQAVSILTTYASAKKLEVAQVEGMDIPVLDKFLAKMWAELRKTDGTLYTKKSMMTIKYGLQRHFSKLREVDIGSDEFPCSSEMFSSMMAKLKQEGKAVVKHKDVIAPEDIKKLYSYLDLTSPQGLQDKVFVDVMIFFCNRGRENLREFSRDDFAADIDDQGKRYVHIVKDKQTKNHRDDDEPSSGGCMYEVPGNPRCPVNSFVQYVARLNPNCDAFWQRPKKKGSGDIWYDNIPVGKNTLGNKMKVLSKQAELSKVYTNHCLRATCITALDQQGFEARHIMHVTGHKSETSIKNYAHHINTDMKRNMSDALAKATLAPVDTNRADFGQAKMHTVNYTEPEAAEDVENEPAVDLDFNDMNILTTSQQEDVLTACKQLDTQSLVSYLSECQVENPTLLTVNACQNEQISDAATAQGPVFHLKGCVMHIHYHK